MFRWGSVVPLGKCGSANNPYLPSTGEFRYQLYNFRTATLDNYMRHEDMTPEKREKLRAYFAAYRAANRERLLEQDRAYRKANKEKLKAYQAAYRQANKERSKAYREANKERLLEYHRMRYKPRPKKAELYRQLAELEAFVTELQTEVTLLHRRMSEDTEGMA